MNKHAFETSNHAISGKQDHHQNAISFRPHKLVLVASLLLTLNACSSMTTRDKNTAIGAGVGAVTGAVLTGGSAWGTVGGAAVGGVIGNQVGRHK